MTPTGSVSSAYAQSYYDTCVARGAPGEALRNALGAGPNPFDNPARRFPNDKLLDMLSLAETVTGDTSIGLEAGRNFRPSTFLDMGLALISAASLREVLKINERYQPLTQELGKTHLSVKPDQARISWRPYLEDPERMRPATEAAFAGYAVFGRWLTWLYDQEIAGMHFRHARPPHADAVEELFACPITYEARLDVMILDPSLVDMPLPQANADLHAVLCARLDKALAEMNAPMTAQTETFHCVQSMLSKGAPSLTRVAAALGMSERTLRRRLAQEGASFRGVLEKARRDACEVYIRERKKSIAEIAQALGYSEQSAFTRAFKTWYGKPPSVYIRAS